MNDTLSTIQKLFNIGRILSKVIMVLCIIGACGSLIGIIVLATIGAEKTFELGGATIHSIIKAEAGMTDGQMYIAMAAGMITTVAAAVVAYFASEYFKHELTAGTPFTFDGAKELKRLGKISIIVPIAGQIVAGITCGIMESIFSTTLKYEARLDGALTMGALFLVMSLIFRYGAELAEGKEK